MMQNKIKDQNEKLWKPSAFGGFCNFEFLYLIFEFLEGRRSVHLVKKIKLQRAKCKTKEVIPTLSGFSVSTDSTVRHPLWEHA
jgi:hypothetical protein